DNSDADDYDDDYDDDDDDDDDDDENVPCFATPADGLEKNNMRNKNNGDSNTYTRSAECDTNKDNGAEEGKQCEQIVHTRIKVENKKQFANALMLKDYIVYLRKNPQGSQKMSQLVAQIPHYVWIEDVDSVGF